MSVDRIEVACPACGQRTAVARENLGRRGRCPACKEIFELKAPVKKSASTVQRTKTKPEADDVLANFPGLGPPLPSAAPSTGDSLWNDFAAPPAPAPATAPQSEPLAAAPPPLPSPQKSTLADDYMRRAREDKPVVQSMEAEPWYRFTTSYGSVIGGTLTFLLGLFFLVSFLSIRAGVVLMISGGGWFIQGLNYVFYYRWKDEEGR